MWAFRRIVEESKARLREYDEFVLKEEKVRHVVTEKIALTLLSVLHLSSEPNSKTRRYEVVRGIGCASLVTKVGSCLSTGN